MLYCIVGGKLILGRSNEMPPQWYRVALQWRRNGRDGVSNHQPHHCLLNRLFGRRSNKTSKPRVTGLCAGNSPETGEFLTQMASNAENVSIWWRHHVRAVTYLVDFFSEWNSLCGQVHVKKLNRISKVICFLKHQMKSCTSTYLLKTW